MALFGGTSKHDLQNELEDEKEASKKLRQEKKNLDEQLEQSRQDVSKLRNEARHQTDLIKDLQHAIDNVTYSENPHTSLKIIDDLLGHASYSQREPSKLKEYARPAAKAARNILPHIETLKRLLKANQEAQTLPAQRAQKLLKRLEWMKSVLYFKDAKPTSQTELFIKNSLKQLPTAFVNEQILQSLQSMEEESEFVKLKLDSLEHEIAALATKKEEITDDFVKSFVSASKAMDDHSRGLSDALHKDDEAHIISEVEKLLQTARGLQQHVRTLQQAGITIQKRLPTTLDSQSEYIEIVAKQLKSLSVQRNFVARKLLQLRRTFKDEEKKLTEIARAEADEAGEVMEQIDKTLLKLLEAQDAKEFSSELQQWNKHQRSWPQAYSYNSIRINPSLSKGKIEDIMNDLYKKVSEYAKNYAERAKKWDEELTHYADFLVDEGYSVEALTRFQQYKQSNFANFVMEAIANLQQSLKICLDEIDSRVEGRTMRWTEHISEFARMRQWKTLN